MENIVKDRFIKNLRGSGKTKISNDLLKMEYENLIKHLLNSDKENENKEFNKILDYLLKRN